MAGLSRITGDSVLDEDWKKLKAALHIEGPMATYKILEIATRRIQDLEERHQNEHDNCIKLAREVLPDAVMHFAHNAVWALAAEVKRLRERTIVISRWDGKAQQDGD